MTPLPHAGAIALPPTFTLDLSDRAAQLALTTYVQFVVARGGRDALNQAPALAAALGHVRDTLLVACDGKGRAAPLVAAGWTIAFEVENIGIHEVLTGMVGAPPPGPGLWVYDGRISYFQHRGGLADGEWDSRYDGEWRQASDEDLMLHGIGDGPLEAWHLLPGDDELPDDFDTRALYAALPLSLRRDASEYERAQLAGFDTAAQARERVLARRARRAHPAHEGLACVYCGCTDDTPCMIGLGDACGWASAEPAVCTNPKCLELARRDKVSLPLLAAGAP